MHRCICAKVKFKVRGAQRSETRKFKRMKTTMETRWRSCREAHYIYLYEEKQFQNNNKTTTVSQLF